MLPFIWYISTSANMLSDFSTISPVWIRYCITEINMESIERNGLYDQIIIISGKKI